MNSCKLRSSRDRKGSEIDPEICFASESSGKSPLLSILNRRPDSSQKLAAFNSRTSVPKQLNVGSDLHFQECEPVSLLDDARRTLWDPAAAREQRSVVQPQSNKPLWRERMSVILWRMLSQHNQAGPSIWVCNHCLLIGGNKGGIWFFRDTTFWLTSQSNQKQIIMYIWGKRLGILDKCWRIPSFRMCVSL